MKFISLTTGKPNDNREVEYVLVVEIDGKRYGTRQTIYNGYSHNTIKNYLINGIMAEVRSEIEKAIINDVYEILRKEE